MDRDLIQQVLNKTLEPTMTPAKIRAYAEVIRALKGTNAAPEPNAIKTETNDEELTESKEIDFSEIEGVQIDGKAREKVKIYA